MVSDTLVELSAVTSVTVSCVIDVFNVSIVVVAVLDSKETVVVSVVTSVAASVATSEAAGATSVAVFSVLASVVDNSSVGASSDSTVCSRSAVSWSFRIPSLSNQVIKPLMNSLLSVLKGTN